jgi:hypothetical protein
VRIKRNARSAVVSSSTPGVFVTATPWAAAAGRSILSKPTDTVAITWSVGSPASITSASVTSVRSQTRPACPGIRATTSEWDNVSPGMGSVTS